MKGYLWSKYGGLQKKDQNRITEKLIKFLFTIRLHFVVVLLQFRLAYLNNQIELRNETCVLIDIHNDHGIDVFVNNVVLV